jgi:hypothetical protein
MSNTNNNQASTSHANTNGGARPTVNDVARIKSATVQQGPNGTVTPSWVSRVESAANKQK